MPLCHKCKRQVERGKKRCPFCGTVQKSFKLFNIPTNPSARLWYFSGLAIAVMGIPFVFLAVIVNWIGGEEFDLRFLHTQIGFIVICVIAMFTSSWIEDD